MTKIYPRHSLLHVSQAYEKKCPDCLNNTQHNPSTDFNSFSFIHKRNDSSFRFDFAAKCRQSYTLLHQLGFRRSVVNNIVTYYRLINNEISQVHFFDIRNAFYDYLEQECDPLTLPHGCTTNEVLNAAILQKAIVENYLLKTILYHELSHSEMETFYSKKFKQTK